MDFIYQLGGIEKVQSDIEVHFRNADGTVDFKPAAIAVTEKVRLDHTIFAEDFTFLQGVVGEGVTPKLTIPSPNMVHYRSGRAALNPEVYSELEPFWADLTAAYAAEIKALAALGCEYLQLDDTSLAYLNDPNQREELTARGEDTSHLHETYVANINNALAGRPAGLTVTTHLCRGNFRSSWVAEGGYDYVAETLFGGLEVDGFFLEYDDARSGGFEPLRFVPPGKMVVLGLVTTKRAALERKEDLVRRIEEAAQHVPIEQLCLSPQCGFSSTLEGNALTHDEQVAKLELIVETAAEVWG
jgi:5-methyltetrahydropteroyltriglutamate--homocysteine methyltransferase